MGFGRPQRTDGSWNALLISADPATAAELAATLPAGVRLSNPSSRQTCAVPDAVTNLISADRPDLCFLDFGGDQDHGFKLLAALASAPSAPPVIVLLSGDDPDLILRCLRRGAAGFVLRPFRTKEIQTALGRIAGLRPAAQGGTAISGKIYGVVPAKGSSGATTVAVNLACQWKAGGTERLLLADMDPITSTMAFLLKLQPQYSFLDAVSRSGELDADLWKALVVPYRGIDVLPSPETPSEGAVDGQDAGDIVEYARRSYEIVVLDLGTPFGPWNSRLANLSDEVVVVLTPELPCVYAAQRTLAYLERKGVPRTRIRAVANRHRRDAGLEQGEMETALAMDVFHLLPNDPEAVERALMEGCPVSAGSQFGKSLAALASRLNHRDSAAVKHSPAGRLRSLFSR